MDDLISRKAAIDAINARRGLYVGTWGKGMVMAIDTLRELPSAQPERKGKWIKDAYGFVICSECKGVRRDNRIGHTNFCNSCGADMREDNDA